MLVVNIQSNKSHLYHNIKNQIFLYLYIYIYLNTVYHRKVRIVQESKLSDDSFFCYPWQRDRGLVAQTVTVHWPRLHTARSSTTLVLLQSTQISVGLKINIFVFNTMAYPKKYINFDKYILHAAQYFVVALDATLSNTPPLNMFFWGFFLHGRQALNVLELVITKSKKNLVIIV